MNENGIHVSALRDLLVPIVSLFLSICLLLSFW